MKLLHASLMSVYFFFFTNTTIVLAFNPLPPATILYELSDQKVCNDNKRTQQILGKFKDRLSQQDSSVIYSWLSTELEFRGNSYPPLVLLGANAYAISWLLERAFAGSERNPGNEHLVQLVRSALNNNLFSRQNAFINNLLQNSFSATNSRILAEVLLNILTSDPEFRYVNIDYHGLIKGILANRNYHLISDCIFNVEGVRNDARSFHFMVLALICRDHSVWETTAESEAEMEWDLGLGFWHGDDEELNIRTTSADQQSTASASTSTSRFGQFLDWLSAEVDTDTLNWAKEIATESRNRRAISWLSARVKANDNVNQDSTQAGSIGREINIVANHDFTVIDLTEPDGPSTQRESSTPDLTCFTNPNYNANTTPSGHQVDQSEQGYFRWLAGLFCFNFIYSRK